MKILALIALIALTGCAAEHYQKAEVDTNCTQNGVCNFVDVNDSIELQPQWDGDYGDDRFQTLSSTVECTDPPNGSDEGCATFRRMVRIP